MNIGDLWAHGYLRDAKRIYTAEQLETTIRRLDERCRVVEF